MAAGTARLACLAALGLSVLALPRSPGAQPLPKMGPPPSHVVVVIMENHAAGQILGSREAPYVNALAARSAVFTQSYAIGHPSQPNYLALFSGSTHGVDDNRCPLAIQAPNLAQQLIAAGGSFVGYAEGLPEAGYTGCSAPTGYVRKHAPWVDFPQLPRSVNQPLAAFPQAGGLRGAEPAERHARRQRRRGRRVAAQDHRCLRAVGAGPRRAADPDRDEDDGTSTNRIATLFFGARLRPGRYGEAISHYTVLRTVEDLFGLPHLGEADRAPAAVGPW